MPSVTKSTTIHVMKLRHSPTSTCDPKNDPNQASSLDFLDQGLNSTRGPACHQAGSVAWHHCLRHVNHEAHPTHPSTVHAHDCPQDNYDGARARTHTEQNLNVCNLLELIKLSWIPTSSFNVGGLFVSITYRIPVMKVWNNSKKACSLLQF
jgi:hypothetical protein